MVASGCLQFLQLLSPQESLLVDLLSCVDSDKHADGKNKKYKSVHSLIFFVCFLLVINYSSFILSLVSFKTTFI